MKNKKLLEKVFVVIAAVLLVFAGLFIFKNKAEAPVENVSNINLEKTDNTSTSTQIANPASLNCEEKGGTLTIMTKVDGGQYGLCEFGEGMACEEWALFRDECPAGGIDISGFESEEQKFCLWLGGNLTQSANTCTLPNDETCDTTALYNGVCPSN
jgi:putative hemolysin